MSVSISSSSVLVLLSISTWTGRKQDRGASTELASNKQAKTSVVSVNKKLLGDSTTLEAITLFAAAVRKEHYQTTLPWANDGTRLLPMSRYADYHNFITGKQIEFEKLLDTFLQSYAVEVSYAQKQLGDLFDPNDYPQESELRDKFKFEFNYIPIPEAGDFRVDLEAQAAEDLKRQYAKFYEDQLSTAMNDVWTRLHGCLSRMSERLEVTADGKRIFRDSLVDNVQEIADLMRDCNLTNDPKMEAARKAVVDALRGVTPDGLRKDEALRRATKEKVDAVIKEFVDFGL